MTTEANTDKKGQPDTADSGIRVLLLDTPDNQGVDFLQSMQKLGLKFVTERVGGKDDLFGALQKGAWDLLLVNDQVGTPGADETLAFLQQIHSDTGYVQLSSGDVTIDVLTNAYKQGMSDVVSGKQPDYSCEALTRAAERSRRNLQLSQLNQEKFELTRHRNQLMSGTEEALAYLMDGIHVFANDAYLSMLGYADKDDLIIIPFIDVISTELRDKVKQQLLDYQHKVRVKPDTEPMEVEDMFVTAVGEKEGILQVSARFESVVYDGENCIQVVLKEKSEKEGKEGGGAMEGLGYPLFVSHLDNHIAEAKSTKTQSGHVVHIRGNGFEHYIAGKGFGSLSGKMKALATELKAGLQSDDFMIRFTENSFLILLKGNEAEDKAKLKAQKELLDRFQKALNKEIGNAQGEALVTINHDVIPVDAKSGSAEELIKSFLMGAPGQPAAAAAEPPAAVKAEPEPEAPAPAAKEPEPAAPAPKAAEPVPSAPAIEEVPGTVNQMELNSALTGNKFNLYYEPVISVKDIETELYDVGAYVDEGVTVYDRAALGTAMSQNLIAGKFDMWVIEHALAVIGELYNQGLEHRILIHMNHRSLMEKRLAENVGKALGKFVLPAGMLMLEFDIRDVLADFTAHADQLEKLKSAGAAICLAGIDSMDQLSQFKSLSDVSLVNLGSQMITAAQQGEDGLKTLANCVKELHEQRLKVAASGIDNSELLNLCVKVKLDLVKGNYIHKEPQPLTTDALSEAMGF